MKKIIATILCLLTYCTSLQGQNNVIGFWKTIDDKTGKQESLVAIYEYQGKYYGRIVVTYDDDGNFKDSIASPRDRAPGVKGNPYYSGMDIIWDMQQEGNRYVDGSIIDPQRGKVYNSKMWPDNGNLVVRGEFLIFGKNQTWLPAKDKDFPPGFTKPNLQALVPKIPEAN